MANIVRGPLYVGRREVPPVLAVSAFAVSSLLCSITSVALTQPLRSGERCLTDQTGVKRGLFPNADTSHGTPKTLLPPDPRQAFLPPQLYPQARPGLFPNASTARGSAKVLLPPDPREPFLPLQLPPISKRPLGQQVVDTTQDTPLVLALAAQRPFVPAPFLWTGERKPRNWLNADTSQDVPKVLLPELVLPRGKQQTISSLARYPWRANDTSQSAYPVNYTVTVTGVRFRAFFIG